MMKNRNPILEEIYAARDQLLAECNDDLHAYVQAARQRALASGRAIVESKKETSFISKAHVERSDDLNGIDAAR